jgi:hypothetical protein
MPVTTPRSYAEKLRDTSHFLHVLDHLLRPALREAGYRVIDPMSRGAQLIQAGIIQNLEQADLVLCDLSSLNANVFFELGIRTSLNRPVALVKDKMTEQIPFDLNVINTHTYDESLTPWTLSSEVERLAEHVKAVDTGAGSGNDMWSIFGLTKRATPAEITGNPIEAKLDLLLTEITAQRDRKIGTPETGTVWGNVHGVGGPEAYGVAGPEEGREGEIVAAWANNAMQDVEGRPYILAVYTRVNGEYVIQVSSPLTDAERSLIQEAALKQLGIRVTIEPYNR